jgi:CDP-6-deoxy-D-xylo-4-hexulose-3-dehydrase
MSTLTAIELGDRRIMPGDEVITTACGFPTTINPIIQGGAIPVFVDIDIPSYNTTLDRLQAALSYKTKAVILAHTLGRLYDVKAIAEWCKANNLWLIEDCCDALGGDVGKYGDMATCSFFPAHNMTTGEGGAVFTDNQKLAKYCRSYRDWGRDCWCNPGDDNTCGKRFDSGYDHKYTYSRIGYNLQMTDLQAAVGCAQFEMLPTFNETRVHNFKRLLEGVRDLTDVFILPEYVEGMIPFGFPITCKGERRPVEAFLNENENEIMTRPIFAGNIIRHGYLDAYKVNYRVSGELTNSDTVYERSFWIGCYHGLNDEQIDYSIEKLREYAHSLRFNRSRVIGKVIK